MLSFTQDILINTKYYWNKFDLTFIKIKLYLIVDFIIIKNKIYIK